MARTSVVAPPPESTAGATILPGVPLPMWGRAEEPVLPDPPPPPAAPAPVGPPESVAPPVAPEPEAAPVVTPVGLPEPLAAPVVTPVGPPESLAEADAAAVEAPEAEEAVADAAEAAVVAEVAEAPAAEAAEVAVAEVASVAEVAPHPYPSAPPPDDELAEALAAPVPALDPPLPAAPVAAAYAAAGAAPPTAPWGTPPAPAPASAPLDLAPPSGAPVEAGVRPEAAPEAPPAIPDGTEPGAAHGRAAGRAGRRPAGGRRPLVLVGAVGGVLVLGAVAAFGWPGFLVGPDDGASTPVAQSQAPVGPTVTLQAPQTVAGLALLPGAAAGALAKAAAATTITGYTAPVSAVYGRGTTPVATVIAWTATSRGRSTDVATAFVGYQSATGTPVTAVAAVPPGTLGGRMSCGSTVVSATPAAVCFWSDDATFGAITVLRPASAAQAAATATAIRSAVEKRG